MTRYSEAVDAGYDGEDPAVIRRQRQRAESWRTEEEIARNETDEDEDDE